jgi:ornithine cyclodeaminase/alanine dehydrogenase-like protein (mu-crystallin family)
MVFLRESDVQRLLPMREAIRRMRQVFEALAAGEARNQARRRLILPSGSILHSMAGAWGDYFGTKIYSTHPTRGAHFLFVLFRSEDAVPLALFEANHLGQIRTGAVTGVATDAISRADAGTVGLIGAGFQARTQLEAVLAVRSIRTVRVWSRTPASAHFLVEEHRGRAPGIEAVESAEAAVREADIVITATSSREPVLEPDWIAPGTHVNAVGSNHPQRRELPAGLIRKAGLIVVDSIEQARMESGDLLLGLADGDWRSVVELQDVIAGTRGVIAQPGAITIFKSNGLGVEDVAAAAHIYEAAQKTGAAQELPIFHS